MRKKPQYRSLFLTSLVFMNLLSLSGQAQRPGIECGCDKYDNYVEPSSKGILIQQGTAVQEGSSSEGKYTVEVVDAYSPNEVNISIFYQNIMIFNESNRATGWGFSPDEDKFVMHGLDQFDNHWCRLVNLNPDPSMEGEWTEADFLVSPTNVSSASIRFSPHGKYLLYAAISGTTGGLLIWVFDTKTGDEVYDGSTGLIVGLPEEKQSVAGWGFSPDKKDATFVHAYLTDVDKYTLVVKNLKAPEDEFIEFATNMEGEARWYFSPCGDYFGWIIDSPYSNPECRLYRTDSEKSFTTVSAITWWKLFSAEDGHYIRYKDGSDEKIVDNTADEKCPDESKPTWEDAVLDTGLVDGTTVELQWDGDTDNVEVTAYKIWVDDEQIKEIEAEIKNYTVAGLEPDSSFKFRIEAGDEAGNWSTDGPEKTFSTFPDNPPFWTDLTFNVKNKTETKIQLEWKKAQDDYGIKFYRILADGLEVGRVGPDTLNYKVKNLVADSSYVFIIEAGDDADQWTPGPVREEKMEPPLAPTWPEGSVLSDSANTETTLIVKWPAARDQCNALTRYELYMNGDLLAEMKHYTREFMVTELEEGTLYEFQVIAYDESDNPSDPLEGALPTLSAYVVSPLIVGPANQKLPDISGNKVVWWDDRNDEGDIYVYDLEADSSTRITSDPHVQFNPSVDEGRIVWTDNRNGNMDIYYYDTISKEKAICTVAGDQDLAEIDGDIIVWRDGRNGNWDIYMYDLSANQESPVCTGSSNQNWPDVSGGYVVYADDRNGNWDIYKCSISDKKETVVCTESGDQMNPVISGTHLPSIIIAFTDGNDIYMYYPYHVGYGADYIYQVPLDEYPFISKQINPHFADKQLVFQDLLGVNDGVNYSVYAYKFLGHYPVYGDKRINISIPQQETNQTHPRTDKGNIVWQYERDGNSDIYIWKRPPGSDLQLSVTELTDPVEVGDTLKYILQIYNDGPNTNGFITTSCELPLAAKFIGASADKGEVIITGKNMTWEVDTMRFEDEVQLEIVFLTYDLAILDFNAKTEGGAFDPDPSNNEVKVTTKVKNVISRFVDEGGMPAMSVENDGTVHLVYFSPDSTIRHGIKKLKGKWEYKTLGFCPSGRNISVVMVQDRTLHVVYSDYNWEWYPASRLFYGQISPTGDWNSRIIGLSNAGFHSLSLDAGTNGELYMAYQEADNVASQGPFRIRRTLNGVWQEAKTVLEEGYDHIDLTVDDGNNIHLSFYALGQLQGIYYQMWAGDLSGPVEEIEPNWHGGQLEGMVTSIITDGTNQPLISYAGSINNDYRENIKYAWKKDGIWKNGMVDFGSYWSTGNQLAMDLSGAVYVGYNHHPARQVRYSTNIPGPWIRQIVDEEIYGWELELAIDGNGNGHLAQPGVKYALIPPLLYFNVDPDSLNFGAVETDSSKTLILKLSNPSGKDMSIDSVRIDDPRFTFNKTSFILERLGDAEIEVTFKQDGITRVDACLQIIYNYPSGMMMDIPVKVTGWHPSLAVDPETIIFGAVPKFSEETRTISLENIGVTDLIFSDINVKYELWPGYEIPTDFTLKEQNCSTLQPGQSCEVIVGFQPDQNGTQYSYLNISSNDPDAPVKKVSLTGKTPAAQIYPVKSSIDFGYCPTGQSLTDSVILVNYGDAVLNITSVNLTGTNANQFSYVNFCTSIDPNDSCKIHVMLNPTKTGDFQANLAITSNSEYSNLLNISLTGSSYMRTLELSAGLINFGSVNVGEQSSALLELRNNGSVDLIVSNIEITGPDVYEFSHNYDCYIISAGTTSVDTVFFTPIYEGSKTATLIVMSNDSYEPEKMIILTGQVGSLLPLQASISADPKTGIAPLTVSFNSVVTGGQPPYQYMWDFRDGATSTDTRPVHQFTTTGTFTVTCTITDVNLQTVIDSVDVAVGSENIPAVNASADPTSGYIPLTVLFHAEISGGNAPLTIQWDFDDGSYSQNPDPVHGFSFPGEYNVKVTVTDADVDIAMDSVLITALKQVSIEGEIRDQEGSGYIDHSTVVLYPEDWENGTVTLQLEQDHTYQFSDIESGNYTVQVIPDTAQYPDDLPTYLGNTLLLSDASWVFVDGAVSAQNINVQRKPENPGGTGTVTGTLIQGENGKKVAVVVGPSLKAGSGIADCYVFLKDAVSGDLEAWDITGSTGSFGFDSLLTGSYLFEADYFGLPMDPANPTLELPEEIDSLEILAIAGINNITIEIVETGMDDLAFDRNFRIYPVPASNRLVVEVEEGALVNGIGRVSIFNITGNQLIAEYPFIAGEKSLELDISVLADGFYLLRIEDGTHSYEIRFIKAY